MSKLTCIVPRFQFHKGTIKTKFAGLDFFDVETISIP